MFFFSDYFMNMLLIEDTKNTYCNFNHACRFYPWVRTYFVSLIFNRCTWVMLCWQELSSATCWVLELLGASPTKECEGTVESEDSQTEIRVFPVRGHNFPLGMNMGWTYLFAVLLNSLFHSFIWYVYTVIQPFPIFLSLFTGTSILLLMRSI